MEIREGLEVLSRRGWLASVPLEMRTELLKFARWHSIQSDEYLTFAGDESGDLIGLVSGVLAFTAAFGLPSTPIMHMARDVFWAGYRPLVLGEHRTVTAQARSTLHYVSFSQTKVSALLKQNPSWWKQFAILAILYGDISAMVAADLLIRDSETRLAAILLRFAGLRSVSNLEASFARLPITQTELAASANLSRNSTGSILRKFEKLGWIKTNYREIVVFSKSDFLGLLEND